MRKTKLHVTAKIVNICGDNGSSTPEGQSWDYYQFGSKCDPVTHISTRKNVVIPLLRSVT